jgi:hypothetical protein
MTAQPSVETARAPRSTRLGLFGQEGTAGFVLRVVVLLIALLGMAAIMSVLELPGGTRPYLTAIIGASLIAITYWWWPAEALFALALFMIYSETTAWYLGGAVKRIDEAALLLIGPIAAWRAFPHWRAVVWWPRDLAIGVALLMGVISSLVNTVPLGIWVPAGLLLAKPIIFFYIVMLSRVTFEEATSGLWIVVAAVLVATVVGFAEMVDNKGFQEFLGLNHYIKLRSENVVVKSLFVHPGLFGYFTAFVSLLLLARYLVTRQLRWLLLSSFVAIGTFLSARRRAILALLAGALAAAVASRKLFANWREYRRTWIPAALAGAVLVVVFASLLTGLYDYTIARYFPQATAEPSLLPGETPLPEPEGEGENERARFALYRGSFQIAADEFPLGGGLGRFGSWMSREHYSPLYEQYNLDHINGLTPENPTAATDTFWPQILGELGVIGLIGYAAYIIALGWMLWRENGREGEPDLRILRLAAGMVFAQALVESAASSMFHSPSRMYLVVLVIGVVASIAWRQPRVAEPPRAAGEPRPVEQPRAAET